MAIARRGAGPVPGSSYTGMLNAARGGGLRNKKKKKRRLWKLVGSKIRFGINLVL